MLGMKRYMGPIPNSPISPIASFLHFPPFYLCFFCLSTVYTRLPTAGIDTSLFLFSLPSSSLTLSSAPVMSSGANVFCGCEVIHMFVGAVLDFFFCCVSSRHKLVFFRWV